MTTARDYSSLRAEYVAGSMSLRELAEQHGASLTALHKRSSREGWQAAREKFGRDLIERAEALLIERNAQELAAFNADDLRVAKSLRIKAAGMLKDAKTPAELRAVATAFEKAQRMGRLALGASTDNQTLFGRDGGPIQQEAVTPQELAEACSRVRDKF